MSKVMNKHLLIRRQPKQVLLPEDIARPRRWLKRASKVQLKPATLAVLIQSATLVTVLVLAWLAHGVAAFSFGVELTFSILDMVLMQALLAAIASYFVGMASWWRWIHFGFPIAVWGMSSWQLPNEFYLAGFVISLSFFWTTFRSQVPFFPSRPIVWRQVAKLMPKNQPVRLIDIGSGLGDMPMYIAKMRPECRIEGIEIAPLPWLLSFVRGQLRRSSAIFNRGDYRTLDFGNYDMVFAYLSPAAMLSLWEKARQEMQSGSLLISLEFEIPGIVPTMRIVGDEHSPMLYVWRLP
jgi:hypothetical protein